MFLEREYRVAQERCRDTLAWAEKERLIFQIRASTLPASVVRCGSGLKPGARIGQRQRECCGIESRTSPLVSQ